MTTPLRANCCSADAVPPVEILRELVTDEQHLVLQFPPAALATPEGAKAALIERLAALMADCTVSDSGGHDGRECVTLARVVTAEEVQANTADFIRVLRFFRDAATALVTGLAKQLGVAPDRLLAELRSGANGVGRLGPDWDYRQHGGECRFTNRTSGQVVEVRLTFGPEYGVLDPYFFTLFVKSTPGLEHLARLLRHGYHDGARVLDLLDAAGHLRAVGNPPWTGRVVRDG